MKSSDEIIQMLKEYVSKFEFKYQAAKHLCTSESNLYNILNGKADMTTHILSLLGYERVVTVTYRIIDK